MIGDFALAVMESLRGDDPDAPLFDATLEVDDDFMPTEGAPVLLVADDGGPAVIRGPWTSPLSPRRPLLRLTAFAVGRTAARDYVIDAAEHVRIHKPGIARVEDIPSPLLTRDRKTGADLASITMPVIVRQPA